MQILTREKVETIHRKVEERGPTPDGETGNESRPVSSEEPPGPPPTVPPEPTDPPTPGDPREPR